MKTYDQRCESVAIKMEELKERRQHSKKVIAAACASLAVVILALVLFVPYDTTPPDVSMYSGSPYYSLIQRINEATYDKPRYRNRFETLLAGLRNAVTSLKASGTDMAPMAPAGEGMSTGNGSYAEITDNQVAGVIEGDLIKRSDRYVYYLHKDMLEVYSIAKEESAMVGRFVINNYDSTNLYFEESGAEMYLSEDCTTVTVILPAFNKEDSTACICVMNLDVTEPSSIHVTNRILVTGSSMTSRLVDGDILLMSKFNINSSKVDFADESTYLPQIGQPGDMVSVAAEDILAPEELSNTHYTVVTRLDSKTLEVKDSAAFLSYSDEIYVSRENIFATRSYRLEEKELGKTVTKQMTEISCLRYADGTLEHTGSVQVEGAVKNQYSMDEHEGVLRVVTSINNSTEQTFANIVSASLECNASLYCVSLDTWQVVASVEKFAPDNEQAESVRFDGDYAYVCTAEVITLTDPVYFFDLSDLSNITCKDTGTIDGYSSSLVNFGDGYLLGIGYGASRSLKIEIYEETETGVASVCSYEADVSFSEEYKSYFIDRENQLIGLGVSLWGGDSAEYLLLHFDGYELRLLVQTPMAGSPAYMRAVLIDGYLYMFGKEFKAQKVW